MSHLYNNFVVCDDNDYFCTCEIMSDKSHFDKDKRVNMRTSVTFS